MSVNPEGVTTQNVADGAGPVAVAATVVGSKPTKKKGTKEKLRCIMEAASALTALGDEESGGSAPPSRTGSPSPDDQEEQKEQAPPSPVKRYIPEHKKPDAALTFPEKLMNMMKFADKQPNPKDYCIAWLPDGKSFVIRNPDEFTRKVLPKFFKATKFSSFTRKLYRWGFRQVNRGIGPDDPIIFGNEYFQRDNAEMMVKMRSITAAGTRKAQTLEAAQAEIEAQRKRPLEQQMEEQRKRMFLESLLQQKTQGFMNNGNDNSGLFGQASLQQSLNLAGALRPGLGLNQPMVNNMKPLGLLNQLQQNSAPNPLNMYLPQQQQQQQNSNGMQQLQQQNYPPASTAEIVNAAINALRFAS